MVAEQVNINAWPYVVSAQELLELSLKSLIKTRDVGYDDDRMKKDGHDLKRIFRSLESVDTDNHDLHRISAGYEAYASLHRDIPYQTLQELIKGVKTDYVLWRYYPPEGWGNKKNRANESSRNVGSHSACYRNYCRACHHRSWTQKGGEQARSLSGLVLQIV